MQILRMQILSTRQANMIGTTPLLLHINRTKYMMP
jgi:hypothetical protein